MLDAQKAFPILGASRPAAESSTGTKTGPHSHGKPAGAGGGPMAAGAMAISKRLFR